MTIGSPNEGEAALLARLLASDVQLRLFKNNLTPGNASVFADFTEATFSGYAAVTLTGGAWTIVAGDPCVGSYAQQTFTCSAAGVAQTIYGYYITAGGKVLWYERYPAASIAAISAVGQNRIVIPRITLKDEAD